MNAPALIPDDTLPALIDRAARALSSARTSGEVLEARDMARTAYDAAKSAGRMMRAKAAHDEVIAAVYRAQADAAVIEARAKIRLADEYDEAQARGEVRKHGERAEFGDGKLSWRDIKARPDEIHEARRLRNAEAAEPGLIERAVNQMVERGEEPTRAALQRSVLAAIEDARRPSPSRRNPEWRPDHTRDAVLSFKDHCGLIAGADIDTLARWDGSSDTRRRMIEAAREALPALQRFINLTGGT